MKIGAIENLTLGHLEEEAEFTKFTDRLNMELEIWATCAQLHLLAETPQPPPPLHLGSYTRALLVSQDRRHLFVTPCL